MKLCFFSDTNVGILALRAGILTFKQMNSSYNSWYWVQTVGNPNSNQTAYEVTFHRIMFSLFQEIFEVVLA